jgi:hypothetical protein
MSKHDDVMYWAKKLTENIHEIEPLRGKMFNNGIDSLNYNELFDLREHLTQYRSLVTLLNETLAQPDPLPRWKRIFRRKK